MTTIPENATLTVKVTAGSVDVFDSSIDSLSGDPVVTPIAPLPVAIPSSATIGPAGGSIRSSDGRLTLRVPAGALTSPVSLSFQPATNDAPQAVGSGYQILPVGVPFAKNALLALAYGRDDTSGANAEALTVAANVGSGWFALGGGSIDLLRRTLTVPLSSTAPSPPASAARGALAAGRSRASLTVVWGITTSWVLSPKRPVPIPTGGQVPLAVSYLGPSSSMAPYESYFLPTKPSETKVTWLVNGAEAREPGQRCHRGDVEDLGRIHRAFVPPQGKTRWRSRPSSRARAQSHSRSRSLAWSRCRSSLAIGL